MLEQRLASGRGGGGRVVAARLRVQREHRLRRVVATDPRQFRLGGERRREPGAAAQRGDDAVEQRHRHPAEARPAAEQREQRVALLARRDRLARAADRQHAVPATVILQAADQVGGEVAVADRLAGGQRPVAEHQERPAALHPLDLARQRLEERGRPDDRVGQAGGDQRCLEGELGVLERQQRLLHADRGEQHELADAGILRRRQHVEMRPMIDRPRVIGHSGARGHAGQHGVEALAAEPVARDGAAIAQIDDAKRRIAVILARGRMAAHQAHHVVPAPCQRAPGGAADGAGGAEQADAARAREAGIVIGGHGLHRPLSACCSMTPLRRRPSTAARLRPLLASLQTRSSPGSRDCPSIGATSEVIDPAPARPALPATVGDHRVEGRSWRGPIASAVPAGGRHRRLRCLPRRQLNPRRAAPARPPAAAGSGSRGRSRRRRAS